MSGESMKKFISIFDDDLLDESLVENILLEHKFMTDTTKDPIINELNEAINTLENYFVSTQNLTEVEEAHVEGIYEGISVALNILKDIANRY